MTSFGSFRIALVTMLVLGLAVSQTAPPQPTVLPVASAEITDLKGAVEIHSALGLPMTAQRGMILTTDSTIETAKGGVLLSLQDGSQVLVKAHSNVVLKNPNQGKGYFLELLIGKILAKVQKQLGSNPSFRMGTPTAVITVRGTRFSVEVNKRRTVVEVFEGLVDVTGLAEGAPHVLIQPGFSTQVNNDRAPEQPRQMNPGESPDDGRAGENSRIPGGDREREGQSPPRQGPPNQPDGKPD